MANLLGHVLLDAHFCCHPNKLIRHRGGQTSFWTCLSFTKPQYYKRLTWCYSVRHFGVNLCYSRSTFYRQRASTTTKKMRVKYINFIEIIWINGILYLNKLQLKLISMTKYTWEKKNWNFGFNSRTGKLPLNAVMLI